MKHRNKKRRLYARCAATLSHTSVKRLKCMLRKRPKPVPIESMRIETMDDLLTRFDPERHGGEVMSKAAPIGREFDAPQVAATAVADQDGLR